VNLKNCSWMCEQLLYTIQHRTVLVTFPLILQTIIIVKAFSTGGGGERDIHQTNCYKGHLWNRINSHMHCLPSTSVLGWTSTHPSPLPPRILFWYIRLRMNSSAFCSTSCIGCQHNAELLLSTATSKLTATTAYYSRFLCNWPTFCELLQVALWCNPRMGLPGDLSI